MRLRTRIIILISLMLIITTLFFGIATFRAQEKALLSGIDARLDATARLAREILPADYHDKISSADSVSEAEYLRIVDRWNRLCEQMNLEYIWSLMLIDGKTVFTSGSSTSKDVRKGDHARFFETHSNPELYTAAFATMKPQYQINDDKWGRIKVALFPFKDVHGRPFLFGASMKTTEVDLLMKKTIRQSLEISAGILFLGVFLSILLSASLVRPLEKLTDLARSITEGNWGQVVETSGAIEIRSLSLSVNEMSRSIQEKVTERRQAEEALREKEEKISRLAKEQRIILTCMPIGVSFLKDRTVQYGNPAFDFIFGYEIGMTKGMNTSEFYADRETYERVGKEAYAAIASGGIYTIETMMKKKDGSQFFCSIVGQAVNPEKLEDGAIWMIQDITDRKQADEILHQSEEKFNKAFHLSPVLTAISTIEDGRFLDVNEIFLQTVSFSREEVIGKTSFELGLLANPAQRRLIGQIMEEKGYARNIETKMVAKNGRIIDGLFSAEPITINNEKCWLTVMVDVTEQKRVAEALYASNELFSLFMHHSPVYTYIKEVTPAQSVVLQASDNYREMIGIPGSEMVGKTMAELFPPEFAEKIIADDWTVVSKGDVLRLDEELNGRSYTTIKFPIIRQDKTLLGGYTIDITGRKQTEEEARELLMMLESVPSSVLIHDVDGNFLYANQRTFEMHGYSREEFMSLNLHRISAPASEKLIGMRMQKLQDHGETSFEVEHLKKGGDVLPLWINVKNATWRGKSVFLSVQTDITERKRVEDVLRESENRYRTLFTGAGDGIFILSTKGALMDVNESFSRMHGYSADEMRNMRLQDLDTPDTFRLVQERMCRLLAGESLTFEVEHYHKDGHIFPLEVSASMISSHGESYIQCFHRDITERRRAEEEKQNLKERLQRAEKMEALGQLAGGVAHDLNNVLGVLTGYSELLLGEIPEGQRCRGYAEKILQSTEKGAAIIQDLLTLARRGVTASDVVNLNSVVSDFLKTPVFEKLKDYHPRVTFQTEYDPNLLNIKGSLVHLEKTLMNLVSNAAEAISGKGEVAIRTENRYLDKPLRGYDEVKEGDYVVLTVSDTGTGIPAENREKIFEPFYTKKTMGRSGTGLGLAIVWGTVKDHSGYIDLQTEVGEGTTFTLYFPVTREEVIVQQQKVPIEKYMGKGESVLVVDDIAEQRDIAARLLTRLGYSVRVVSSGEEAVEYLKENKADILVLDMIMAPGIDGLETYQRVLEINPKQKAVLVSGFSETDRVKKSQELGAGAYVKKPYIMEKIGVAIRNELGRT